MNNGPDEQKVDSLAQRADIRFVNDIEKRGVSRKAALWRRLRSNWPGSAARENSRNRGCRRATTTKCVVGYLNTKAHSLTKQRVCKWLFRF